MNSFHRIFMEDAHSMVALEDHSVDLMVTSPPYPMIEMWDDFFCQTDPAVGKALQMADARQAFELMHQYLDGIWAEVYRVLRPGGIMCINIGDAVRTVRDNFQLFSNHARIISYCLSLGCIQLPAIIWRKPTNAPNKFMGSGMLPPGAYVTLEHEYILIFRKGGKRDFPEESDKKRRRESAFFWEERNSWFSDVWFDLRGVLQKLTPNKSRERSAAFPFELPFRLINMFSLVGDMILDPFLGTGTTMLAAMCTARNSVGYDIDPALQSIILEKIPSIPDLSKSLVTSRLSAHTDFVAERIKTKGGLKHYNQQHAFAVVTNQEKELLLYKVKNIQYIANDRIKVMYEPCAAKEELIDSSCPDQQTHRHLPDGTSKGRQLKLF